MINKSKKILSEISVGELLDKISILEIKLNKIKNQNSQKEIKKEYNLLKKTKNLNIKGTVKIKELTKKLKVINLRLWGIEDKIRICEKNKDFGKKFIELARAVYSTNDKRSKIKLEINQLVGSNIIEIKQYVDY
jgi:dsDNA-specific endonuclease/ATPase MutS2